MFILAILAFYQNLINQGDISTTTIRDYVIVRSIQEGYDPQRIQKIVKCESKYRQFNDNGKPLISPTSDAGIMQINIVHWKEAKNMNLDIFNSPVDNIEMGMKILKKQGYSAWTCNS